MVPVPLIRRNYIVKKLRRCNAFSPQTAVTFEEAGVFNPHGFPGVTRMMILQKRLVETNEGRYYLQPR